MPLPANLAEWLDAATGNLIPSAQARIRAEIQTHYNDGVDAKLKEGASYSAAHAAALADLGDAEAARKRFGQEHPSMGEVKAVAVQTSVQIVLGLVWTTALCTLSFRPHTLPELLGLPGLLFLLGMLCTSLLFFGVLPVLFFFMRARVQRSGLVLTSRLVSMLLALSWANIGAFLVINIFFGSLSHGLGSDYGWFPILIATMSLPGNFFLFRLRKKLASAQGASLFRSPSNHSIPPRLDAKPS